jgi:hypothetical protein
MLKYSKCNEVFEGLVCTPEIQLREEGCDFQANLAA